MLLVDDSPVFLEALRAWVGSQEDLDVVACACSGAEALALARQVQPQIVLMDVAMPELNGIEATRLLKLMPNAPAVLILTHDPAFRAAAVAAGAEAFLCKSDIEAELLPCVRRLGRRQ